MALQLLKGGQWLGVQCFLTQSLLHLRLVLACIGELSLVRLLRLGLLAKGG